MGYPGIPLGRARALLVRLFPRLGTLYADGIGSIYNAGEAVIGTKKARLVWPSPAEAVK